jgi:CrcB protein
VTGPLVFVAIALAGGAGAALRLVVDGVVRSVVAARTRPGSAVRSLPLGTALINVTGSFALGLLTGSASASAGGVSHEVLLVVGGGLIGGYTTFSTASVETVRLLAEGRRGAGVLNVVGVLALSVGAAVLGVAIGG